MALKSNRRFNNDLKEGILVKLNVLTMSGLKQGSGNSGAKRFINAVDRVFKEPKIMTKSLIELLRLINDKYRLKEDSGDAFGAVEMLLPKLPTNISTSDRREM